MKNLILLILCLSIQSLSAQNEEINWIDFEELETSLDSNAKPVVIYFYTNWCVYCKKMDRNAFKNDEVITTLNRDYYAVKMNAESLENIEFDGQVFRNEQAKTQRNGIHQIAQLLAGRDNRPISFPVVMVLDENFRIKKKSHEYLTTANMKTLIQNL